MSITMKRLLLLVVYVGISKSLFSQLSNIEQPKIIPPSPESAAIGKYGDYPVNYYTGESIVNIPLYTLKEGDINIPISLSYKTSGIKMNEAASWVGLGWTLNCGGTITRTIRGLADEEPNGYFNSPDFPSELFDPNTNSNEQACVDYLYKSEDGQIDTEPDIYFFNFNGVSGKFVFDKDRTPYTIPYQDIKIVPNDNDFSSWTITTPDGMQYLFGKIENENAIEETTPRTRVFNNDGSIAPGGIFDPGMLKVSSWYLVKVISPTGHAVTFDYNYSQYISCSQHAEHVVLKSGNFVIDQSKTYTESMINGIQLSNINGTQSSIIFKGGAKRQDVEPTYYSNPDFPTELDYIEIRNENDIPLKKYKFHTTYFLSGSGTLYSSKRLKLDKVEQVIPSSGESELVSEFIYNSTKLPDRFSYSVDHWGYYNGESNQTLIPDFKDIIDNHIKITGGYHRGSEKDYIVATHYNFNGANRNPSASKMKACILKEIHYPTGGYSKFNYHPNTFSVYDIGTSTPPKTIVQRYLNEKLEVNPDDPPSELDHVPDIYEKTFVFDGESSTSFNISGFYPSPKTTGCPHTNHELKIYDESDNELFSFDYSDYQYVANDDDDGYSISDVITLHPDQTYRLYLKRYCGVNSIWIKISGNYNSENGEPTSGIYEIAAGGLRIRNIETNNGDGQSFFKEFSYIKESEGKFFSSGIMLPIPRYHQYGTLHETMPVFVKKGMVSGINSANIQSSCLSLRSGSLFDLGTTQGGKIGYEFVTVKDKAKVNGIWKTLGKTVYNYHSLLDYQDRTIFAWGRCSYINSESYSLYKLDPNDSDLPHYSKNFYPYAPQISYNWKRGLLKSIETYDENSKIKTQEYNYNPVSEETRRKVIPAVLVKRQFVTEHDNILDFAKYETLCAWNYKTHEKETLHTNGNTLTTTEYIHDSPDHALITMRKDQDSKGKLFTTKFSYPNDYSGDNSVMDELINRNMVGIVIKQERTLENNIISGVKRQFKLGPINNNLLWDDKRIIILDNSSSYNTNNQEYTVELRYDSYSNSGNLLQYHKESDINNSVIWTYNSQFPVVKADNIDYLTLKTAVEIAAGTTNLEDFWDQFKKVDHSNLQYKNFNNALRNNVNLKRASISTYTYDPLIGMTSKTDPNGITTYYEYDDFGRLKLVRDSNGNILQEYKYNYKNN